jgi:hypothetical protein
LVGKGSATWRVAVIGALTVPWLAACSLLYGYPPLDPDEFPDPSVVATYRTGSATITLDDGTVLDLPDVAAGASLNTLMGTTIRWTGADGWHLRLTGAGIEGAFGGIGGEFVQFDRLVDGEHWTTLDAGRCIVDIEQADARRVLGSASCKGVTWFDALDQGFGLPSEPKPIDVPAFDAELTFEAAP